MFMHSDQRWITMEFSQQTTTFAQNTVLPMDNNKNITKDQIAELESKLSELIDMADQLKVENASLRAQQSNLVAEKSRLIEKNELARSKVEAIITRLKSLESA